VLNRGHWVLPIAPGCAVVGATHQPGLTDAAPTLAARAALEASAQALLGRAFAVTGHTAGVRVNLPDKRPVAGRHPADSRLGVCNGLGAKGALVGPALARQWAQHLATGAPFDAAVAVGRFFSGDSSQA
jgi:glycine/D-amino acid oxidase-like deaminating enzyme